MAVDIQKRNKRQQKWTDENRDRINLVFSKGLKEKIFEAAKIEGLSMSQYVEKAIKKQLENSAIN